MYICFYSFYIIELNYVNQARLGRVRILENKYLSTIFVSVFMFINLGKTST